MKRPRRVLRLMRDWDRDTRERLDVVVFKGGSWSDWLAVICFSRSFPLWIDSEEETSSSVDTAIPMKNYSAYKMELWWFSIS